MKACLTSLLLLSLLPGNACDYLPLTLRAAVGQADLLVQARVVALRDSVHYDLYSRPLSPPFRSGYRPVLRISQVLKGQLRQRELALAEDGSGGACAAYFEVGQEYVVFLTRWRGGYISSPAFPNFPAADKHMLRVLRSCQAIDQ